VTKDRKTKMKNLMGTSALILVLAAASYFINGCYIVKLFIPEKPPSDKQLKQSYTDIQIYDTNSSGALETIHHPNQELLSRSKKVIVSHGEENEGRKFWFNMVGFDENTLTATRKYLFIANEQPKSITPREWRRLIFNGEIVIEAELLEKPFTSDNDKKVAVFKSILETFNKDLNEVKTKDKNLGIAGMLAREQLETIFRMLENSPSLASKLDSEVGLEFEHRTFGKGSVIMKIGGDTAQFEIYINSPAGNLESPFKLR